jgi:excinuclease ABC subunit C
MDAEFAGDEFIDFGPDPLYPFEQQALQRLEGQDTDDLRSQVRRLVPKVPGIYGMLDLRGRLIYVGKSKAVRNRLLSYFMPNNEEDKAGRILQSTSAIVWEQQPSEFAALVREQALIRQFQPRFNVQGIPRRQQPIFVCLGRAPAEQLYVARRHDPKAIAALGPLLGAGRAGRAVEVLNRLLGLRDCSSKQPCSFTEQLRLFEIDLRPGCIRLELKSCLGPCISACSRQEYDAQVRRAKNFLAGEDTSPLLELQAAMHRAASGCHFEWAARLRDDLTAVSWLARRAEDISQAQERYTFVYPVESSNGEPAVWYLIRRGVLEGAVAEPKNARERRKVMHKIEEWLAADNHLGPRFSPRPETLALVASWFRNHRGELKRTFTSITKPGIRMPT